MAVFRGEMNAALRFIEEASPFDADPNEVLEPEGPVPLCEGWRRAFQRGTCLALIGGQDEEAEDELRRAEGLDPTAEVLNNRGVVLARLGRLEEAYACWENAERCFPGYMDAVRNRENPAGQFITTHPLRRQPSRSEY
jgi:tetratricopeptide (TPR) repeat protein